MALPGRTTPELVAAIIEVDEDLDLNPFIDVANDLVTMVCAVIPTGGYDYTTDYLAKIETWLAAHFYAIEDPRSQRDRIGSLTQEIESKVDLGFDVTRYGQMAMRLDLNLGLAKLNNAVKDAKGTSRIVGGVKWLGTPACRIPYLDI